MKIIALGDTHGRTKWKHIAAKETDFDKLIFIGDYFDSREDIPPQQQIKNFKEIISFKKSNLDKVVLLLGNHDFHYLPTTIEHYSGFQRALKEVFGELIQNAISEGLIQLCFKVSNVIFSHAGVTKTWCKANNIDMEKLESSINELFINKPNAFQFTEGYEIEETGDEITQTPIWVRPRSLALDRIDNYIQVVGHTTKYKLIVTGDIILIDTLGTSGEYLAIVNGEFTAKSLLE